MIHIVQKVSAPYRSHSFSNTNTTAGGHTAQAHKPVRTIRHPILSGCYYVADTKVPHSLWMSE